MNDFDQGVAFILVVLVVLSLWGVFSYYPSWTDTGVVAKVSKSFYSGLTTSGWTHSYLIITQNHGNVTLDRNELWSGSFNPNTCAGCTVNDIGLHANQTIGLKWHHGTIGQWFEVYPDP